MTTIYSHLRSLSTAVSVAFLLIAGMSSCTKHYATATTAAAPAAATSPVAEKKAEPVATTPLTVDTTTGPSLHDSLVGTWRLRTVELDNAVTTLSSYGTQAERDQMVEKQKQFQDALKGLVATFAADGTYTSGYAGNKDAGTWRVTRRRGLDTISKTDGNSSSYQVQSVTASTLVVLLDASDVKLVLTLDRQ